MNLITSNQCSCLIQSTPHCKQCQCGEFRRDANSEAEITCIVRCGTIIDTSIIHDTLAVIANEVKQSSKIKDAFCLNHPDCRAGCASAALRSHPKSCCNDDAFRIHACPKDSLSRVRRRTETACQFLISPCRILEVASLPSNMETSTIKVLPRMTRVRDEVSALRLSRPVRAKVRFPAAGC